MSTRRKTQEEFIAEAITVHGNKYDYSKVCYVNNRTAIEIICSVHGSFWQTPKNHLRGHNYQAAKSGNKEEFVSTAKEIHGNKYDYSLVKYVNCETKVEIICPIHGSFWQLPRQHARGSDCKSCVVDKQKGNTEKFVSAAKEIHGNKYDYSLVKYVNNHTKVEIICPIHGSFWQIPSGHEIGGCKACDVDKRRGTAGLFVTAAKRIHGDKYDYSLVKYVNSHTKVEIVCPVHGSFKQEPSDHTRGSGCKMCAREAKSSKNEILLRETIKNDYPSLTVEPNFREHPLISPYEIDIWLPEIGLGIEWNGIFWHGRPGTKKIDQAKKEVLGDDLIQIDDRGMKPADVIKIYEQEVRGKIQERVTCKGPEGCSAP